MHQASRVEYTDCLVSFIDILGFKSIVKNKSAEEIYKILEKLRNFTDASGRFKTPYSSESPISEAYAYSISDAVVRVRPYKTTYRDGALFRELSYLVLAQTDLLNEGILIRGGLAIGKCYIGSDNDNGFPVFGPALIKAYEAEECSKYPRIIVEKEVIEAFDKTEDFIAEQHKYNRDFETKMVAEFLKKEKEEEKEKYFIDYLLAFEHEHGLSYTYFYFLKKHAELIRKNFLDNSDSPKVLEKLEWLKKYHNDKLNIIRNHFSTPKWINIFISEFEITPEEFFDCITIK